MLIFLAQCMGCSVLDAHVPLVLWSAYCMFPNMFSLSYFCSLCSENLGCSQVCILFYFCSLSSPLCICSLMSNVFSLSYLCSLCSEDCSCSLLCTQGCPVLIVPVRHVSLSLLHATWTSCCWWESCCSSPCSHCCSWVFPFSRNCIPLHAGQAAPAPDAAGQAAPAAATAAPEKIY